MFFKLLMSFGVKVVLHLFALMVITGLMVVWIATAPIFKFSDQVAHGVKRKIQKRKLGKKVVFKGDNLGFISGFFWITAMAILGFTSVQAQTSLVSSPIPWESTSKPSTSTIWQNRMGEGFIVGVQSISLEIGAGYGVKILGSRQSHDLALVSLSYGYMLGYLVGKNRWYAGNWEFRGELFSGAQFSPSTESLVGLTPHLRYNFATGTRWIPYVDIGAGVSATSIGPPDLSHTFEFNLQGATGVQWLIKDNVALSIEARYLHMSCAGMSSPNLGLNNVNGMVGITWFF